MRDKSGVAQPDPQKVIPIRLPARKRRVAIVDELGRIHEQLGPLQAQYSELRAEVLLWHQDAAPAEELTLEGAHYRVEISAQSHERQILSLRSLWRRLGAATFLRFARFPLAALDQHLSPEEQAGFVTSSQTGPRRLVITRKMEGEKAG